MSRSAFLPPLRRALQQLSGHIDNAHRTVYPLITHVHRSYSLLTCNTSSFSSARVRRLHGSRRPFLPPTPITSLVQHPFSTTTSETVTAASVPSPANLGPSGPSSVTDLVVMTKHCVDKVVAFAEKRGVEPMLRLQVDAGGCSGFEYQIEFDDEIEDDDILFKQGGATLVVDSVSLPFVKGATVDYVEEMIRSSFAVTSNPNADTGCGCGTSFSVKE